MKLLLITAITEFEIDIKTMLKKADVKVFSHKNVIGYKDISEESIDTNWFASEMNETNSIVFYAFINKDNVEMFFELAANFNSKQETLSHIHVVSLNIEKSN